MEQIEIKKTRKSRLLSLLFLIPSTLFGVISIALSIVGFGLIPIVPSLISIVFSIASYLIFKKSFRIFTIIIVSISLVSSLYSVFQVTFIKKTVAKDINFDNTVVKAQEGVNNDLGEAFSDKAFTDSPTNDTTKIITDEMIGEQIYTANCTACHQPNGMGIEGIYPPLAGSDYLKNADKTIEAILFGLGGKLTVNGKIYNKPMPASELSDEEVFKLMKYVSSAWGNPIRTFTIEQVNEIRTKKALK